MGYRNSSNSGGESDRTCRKVARVVGKVREASSLVLPKPTDGIDNLSDLFCEISLVGSFAESDGKFTSAAKTEPIWEEEFCVDSKTDFTDVRVLVCRSYKTNEGIKRLPIGKVTIPRTILPAHTFQEQVYLLQDASLDDRVAGKAQLTISHIQDESNFKHIFTVKVVKAKDLSCNGPDEPNCYAALYLLPDPLAMSCQKTSVQPTSNCPQFSETFTFTCGSGEKEDGLNLLFSVWDDNMSSDASKSFLGHVCIPLAPIMKKKSVNRWYPLGSLNNDADLSASKMTNNKIVLSERNHSKELVKKLNASYGKEAVHAKTHKLVNKAFLSTSCTVCNQPIVGREMACSECDAPVHAKCKNVTGKICGGVGLIKLQLDLKKLVTLDNDSYRPFIDLISSNEFIVFQALGKVDISQAEEAAYLLMKVFGISDYEDFVISIIRKEIRATSSSATLFRSNSMASKALEVLLRAEAFDYLQSTLEDVLRYLIGGSKSKKVEIDVSRLTSDADLSENVANLMQMNIIIADTIFASSGDVPTSARKVFQVIKEEIAAKFPSDFNARYTAVSGFFFNRFIIPAIMNPGHFKLKVGPQSPEASRKLLLISKTLQNLSNLADTGKNEAFMTVMDDFITSRLDRMREFLDQISSTDFETESPKKHLRAISFLRARGDFDPSKESADLARLLQNVLPKLRDAVVRPDSSSHIDVTIFNRLEQEIARLENQAATMQAFDIPGDIGVDARDVSFVSPAPAGLTKSQSKGSMVELFVTSTDILDFGRLKPSQYQTDRFYGQPSTWARYLRLAIFIILAALLGLGIGFAIRIKGIKLG